MRKNVPVDKLDFQWPDADQFLIGMNVEGRHIQQKATPLQQLLGHANSNIKEPYLSGVCKLVHCQSTSSYCSQPVKPVGQCCPTCGAFLTFRQNILNFSQASAVVLAVEDRLLKDHPKVGISFSKLDEFDLQPLYQIAVIGADSSVFDEDVFYGAVKTTFDEIQADAASSVHFQNIQPAYFDERTSCSIENGKIHWGKVFKALLFVLALLVVFALAFRQQYKHSPRLRLLMADSRSSLGNMSASWQSAGRVELRRANRRLSLLFGQQRRGSRLEELVEGGADPRHLHDHSIFHAEFANQAFSNILYEDDQPKEEGQLESMKPGPQQCEDRKLIQF
uniref:Protein amnionless n=1 Tax=Ditylenchus dipsaci TaxID=166011 RepID=A0A915EMK0_9BILA